MRAVIALGGNLGDRLTNLQSALTALRSAEGIEVLSISEVFETEPIGPAQPKYANAVCLVETSLEAMDLLATCQKIENDLGRVRAEHWGPRTMDLDLIDIENFHSNTDDLTIPHPEATNRSFVLVPLAQLAPEWQLAGKSAREWAAECEPLPLLGTLTLEAMK